MADGQITVLENCRISPPPNSVGPRSLPLTFFDLPWLLFPPVHQLFFYHFPHPKSHFINSIIPNLKHSLSITLQHFFPMAGNLILFPNQKPQIRHVEGDSLALTFAECSLDFNHLKSNHPRDCNKFHPLVPLLESPIKASDAVKVVKVPVFSVQVTVFPNSGITIGLTNHHALCDARTRYGFLMAWASIAKHGTDELFLSSKWVPSYDRAIEYPDSLDHLVLNLPPIRSLYDDYKVPELVPVTDKLRSTVVLTRSQIVRLKKCVLGQVPSLEYVSSFAIGCGLVWSCVAKSRVEVEGDEGAYEVEHFTCVADWRARMDPPLPETYFGNCLGPCVSATATALIAGPKGFSTAVELASKGVREGVKSEQGVFKDAETWLEKVFVQVPMMGVAGTPKLNVYEVDFGWGRPEKYETVSLDFSDSISINATKESSEDLEIGLCLPAKQMDVFTTLYRNELESILSRDDF